MKVRPGLGVGLSLWLMDPNLLRCVYVLLALVEQGAFNRRRDRLPASFLSSRNSYAQSGTEHSLVSAWISYQVN